MSAHISHEVVQAFTADVSLPDAEGHMHWTGATRYGTPMAKGWAARRVAALYFLGEIPIRPVRNCGVKDCVAPNHLIL